jgi:hypothetical protein
LSPSALRHRCIAGPRLPREKIEIRGGVRIVIWIPIRIVNGGPNRRSGFVRPTFKTAFGILSGGLVSARTTCFGVPFAGALLFWVHQNLSQASPKVGNRRLLTTTTGMVLGRGCHLL